MAAGFAGDVCTLPLRLNRQHDGQVFGVRGRHRHRNQRRAGTMTDRLPARQARLLQRVVRRAGLCELVPLNQTTGVQRDGPALHPLFFNDTIQP